LADGGQCNGEFIQERLNTIAQLRLFLQLGLLHSQFFFRQFGFLVKNNKIRLEDYLK